MRGRGQWTSRRGRSAGGSRLLHCRGLFGFWVSVSVGQRAGQASESKLSVVHGFTYNGAWMGQSG